MPQVSNDLALYLDFDQSLPCGELDVSHLPMEHVYNFNLKLNVPDSDVNQGLGIFFNLGNFMVTMDLISHGEKVASEKRPIKLKYRSLLLRK